MLNLGQLYSFVVVAEELNFRKAAERLHLTQPPVSRQVKLLEEDLGVKLFLRSRQSVRLTEAGSVLLEEARGLFKHARQIEELVERTKAGTGRIKVGVTMNLGRDIHRVGIEFLKRHPKADLQYVEMPSTLQNRALRKREIDVGFVRPPVESDYLQSEYLFQQPFVVVLPSKSPLARLKKVKLAQLAEETLLLFPRRNNKGVHDKVLAMYRNAGITPKIVHTTSSPHHAGSMLVASGKGIYMLSAGRIVLDKDLAAVPLDEPEATMAVLVAWRKNEKSPFIHDFLETVRGVFKTGKGINEAMSGVP